MSFSLFKIDGARPGCGSKLDAALQGGVPEIKIEGWPKESAFGAKRAGRGVM